jgi:integrase/recombinase XerD
MTSHARKNWPKKFEQIGQESWVSENSKKLGVWKFVDFGILTSLRTSPRKVGCLVSVLLEVIVMPAKGTRHEMWVAGNASDPQSLGTLLRKYLEALQLRNYSAETIKKRRLQLNAFVLWCELRSLTRMGQITRTELERYQRQLPHEVDRTGKPRSIHNQHERLMSVRSWFKWLARKRFLLHNPASEIDLPQLGQHLPARVLTANQVEAVLTAVDLQGRFGLRDRSMLETLYSTGMRRMELAGLQLGHLDAERGLLTIRQGKGKRDRIVPIGDRALRWLNRYLTELRPRLLVDEAERTVYLTRLGDPFSGSSLSALVAAYVRKSGVSDQGSCHLFRHAMATAMHDAGADIRYIQAMLGHAKLDTTQIYTRVSVEQLKAIHRRTHPAGGDLC